jgi:magnesium transporter
LQPIVAGESEWVSDELALRFSHVRDHLTTTIETVDNLRELLHGVLDGYRASLSNRMNSIMQTLTIFASLFLPLGLIAGIYGMNTPLWPPANTPHAFWLVIGGMAVLVVAMVGFFKYKRWF